MGKVKPSKYEADELPETKDWVRGCSLGIIIVCIVALIGLLGLVVWRATKNNPEVNRVLITTDLPSDSLRTYIFMDYEQADSLIRSVRKYDEQLTQKYQYLIEQKEQDNQIFTWGSLIVGVVIALFGWFGFQSFATIEDKAKKKAGAVAYREAWSATNVFLKSEGKSHIQEVAENSLQDDAVKKVKDLVVNELNTIIENRMDLYLPAEKVDNLERRLDSVESSVGPNIDKAVKAAVKDIFEKYRKPIKGESKDKEEEK